VGGDTAPQVSPEEDGWWWSVLGREPIGFAGLQRSQRFYDMGYLCRSGVMRDHSGVMRDHRGHGLQVRLPKKDFASVPD
jgi:hypothetical protein